MVAIGVCCLEREHLKNLALISTIMVVATFEKCSKFAAVDALAEATKEQEVARRLTDVVRMCHHVAKNEVAASVTIIDKIVSKEVPFSELEGVRNTLLNVHRDLVTPPGIELTTDLGRMRGFNQLLDSIIIVETGGDVIVTMHCPYVRPRHVYLRDRVWHVIRGMLVDLFANAREHGSTSDEATIDVVAGRIVSTTNGYLLPITLINRVQDSTPVGPVRITK